MRGFGRSFYNRDIKMEIKNLTGTPPYGLLLDADPSKEFVDGYLKKGICRVAEEKGRISGVYILMPRSGDLYEIMNVAVRPDMQGRGVGRLLVDDACRTAEKLGAAAVEVGTGNCGTGQLAFYQKCGFRITGIKPDFFTDNYPEPIIENGILCRDMIMLSKKLK